MPPALVGCCWRVCWLTPYPHVADHHARDKTAADDYPVAFVGGSPLKQYQSKVTEKSVLSAGAGLLNTRPEDVVKDRYKPLKAWIQVPPLPRWRYRSDATYRHLSRSKTLNDLRDKRGFDFAMLLSPMLCADEPLGFSPQVRPRRWTTSPIRRSPTARATPARGFEKEANYCRRCWIAGEIAWSVWALYIGYAVVIVLLGWMYMIIWQVA